MKTRLLLILFLFAFVLHAQEKVKFIQQGVLTMKNNEKIQFSNLRYEEDKVFFINVNTQLEEHLFQDSILSIDEGEIEYVEKEVTKKSTESFSLKDGVYQTFDSLKVGESQPGTYKVVAKNPNRNLYQVVDANGKKVKKDVFAYVEDGVLYLRGGSIRQYQTNKRGLTFKRNAEFFIKMESYNGQYSGRAIFMNTTVSYIGAVISGGTAGALAPGIGQAVVFGAVGVIPFILASTTQKEVVLDLQNEEITLR